MIWLMNEVFGRLDTTMLLEMDYLIGSRLNFNHTRPSTADMHKCREGTVWYKAGLFFPLNHP